MDTRESSPHTPAWITFEKNLESVIHFLSLGMNEISLMRTKIDKLVNRPRNFTNKATVTRFGRSINQFLEEMTPLFERFQTVSLWQVVILVTCVEAYLQDILIIAASIDPELMSKSEQKALYAEIIASASLEELANNLRRRWARNWLNDGGPTSWISRFERMGVSEYPKGLAQRLELIWGIRHIIVHTAGVADNDFVKRHPGIVKAVGDYVKISIPTFSGFVKTINDGCRSHIDSTLVTDAC